MVRLLPFLSGCAQPTLVPPPRLYQQLEEAAALLREGGGLAVRSGISVSNITAAAEEEEKRLRQAPKLKPKLDPKTGKWVVKSWDGLVAGIEGGDARLL